MIQTLPSALWSFLWALSMISVFFAERLATSSPARWAGLAVAAALFVGALGARVIRGTAQYPDRQKVERIFGFLIVLSGVALGLYFLSASPVLRNYPRTLGILSVLWPALLCAVLFPTFFGELSYASIASAVSEKAQSTESGRVRDAFLAGLGLSGALVFAFSAYYVASELDRKWDFSYFRTAKPGQASLKIIHGLDAPLDVSLFFPPANEVSGEVAEFFSELAKQSTLLKVGHYDIALDPLKAKELGVTGNGAVVISRGAKKEQLLLGLDLERAGTQLRALDSEIQKMLLAATRPKRILYFTTGHGERSATAGIKTDQRVNDRLLRQLLTAQNNDIRPLGAAEGLANEVPADAAAVFIIGPTQNLLPQEIESLIRYFRKEGRLFVALDPEPGLDFRSLMTPLGLIFDPVELANDKVFARISNQINDRANIVSASFTSHPSVSTLNLLGNRSPLVLLGAGSVERAVDVPADLTVEVTVRAMGDTWNDVNPNFTFDPPREQKKAWGLVATAARRNNSHARAVVVADSDALSDWMLEKMGNPYLALDTTKWMLGDDAISGTVNSETDLPVQHTKKEDVTWFYLSVFLFPAAVLGIGAWVGRRRRNSARVAT